MSAFPRVIIWLRSLHGFASPGEENLTLRQQLRVITTAWFFGAVWMFIILGATLSQYAKSLGAPEWGFGIIAAAPFIGALARLPASYILERFGRRRQIFLFTLTFSRFLWVVAAAIPWIMPESTRPYWWVMMAATLIISWLMDAIGGTAWMNWMADVVPPRLRGRYFAFRQKATRPVVLIVMLLVGWLLDVAQRASEVEPGLLLTMTSAILMLAGLLGMLDIQCFTRLPDPAPPVPKRGVSWFSRFREPLGDRNFRRYLAFNFTFTLGMGFMGAYVLRYVLDVAQLSNMAAIIMLGAVPMLATALVYTFWGRMVDRYGKRPVLVLAGAIVVFGPWGWFLVTPEHWLLGYTLTLISPLAFAGIEVANFNMILGMSSDGSGRKGAASRAPQVGGSAYVALHSLAVAAGGILSGLIGAAVAGAITDFRLELPALGLTWTYHHVLLALSAALRGAALCIALTLVEPDAAPLSTAARHLVSTLTGQVRRLVTLPERIATVGLGAARRLRNAE